MQVEVERNLSEILILHEEILIQLKIFLRDASSRHSKTGTKHHRGSSGDSGESKIVQKDARGTRLSMESLWFRQFRARCLTSEAQEAAEIAKVFDRMVCHLSPTEQSQPF